MDLVDLVLSLLIGLALLSQVVTWLIEQFGGQKPKVPPLPRRRPRDILDTDDELSAVESGEASMALSPQIARAGQAAAPAPAAAPLPTAAERGRRLRRQLGLDRRSELQRSIVLMTVLGPCRANERVQRNAPRE
jgi:hypothetical protein